MAPQFASLRLLGPTEKSYLTPLFNRFRPHGPHPIPPQDRELRSGFAFDSL